MSAVQTTAEATAERKHTFPSSSGPSWSPPLRPFIVKLVEEGFLGCWERQHGEELEEVAKVVTTGGLQF